MSSSAFVTLCTGVVDRPTTPIPRVTLDHVVEWISAKEGNASVDQLQGVMHAFNRLLLCMHGSLYAVNRDAVSSAECRRMHELYAKFVMDVLEVGIKPRMAHCRSLAIAVAHSIAIVYMPVVTVYSVQATTVWESMLGQRWLWEGLVAELDYDDDYDVPATEMAIRMLSLPTARGVVTQCMTSVYGDGLTLGTALSSACALGRSLSEIRRTLFSARVLFALQHGQQSVEERRDVLTHEFDAVLVMWEEGLDDVGRSVHGCVDALLVVLRLMDELHAVAPPRARRIARLCTSTYAKYRPVVTHSTPEGRAIVDQEADVDDVSRTNLQTHLALAFRACNAVTIVVMADEFRAIFEGENDRADLTEVVTSVFCMLTQSTHRGTFECAFTCLMFIGRRWRHYSNLLHRHVFVDWWEKCVLSIVDDTQSTNRLSLTRRSAGLPQAIVVLVFMLGKMHDDHLRGRRRGMTNTSVDVLSTTVNALLRTAVDVAVDVAARLCALHTLRHLQRERSIGTAIHDEHIMRACLRVAAEEDIRLQYACAMLFAESLKRLFQDGSVHITCTTDDRHLMRNALPPIPPDVLSEGEEGHKDMVVDVSLVAQKFPSLLRHITDYIGRWSREGRSETFALLLCLQLVLSSWRRFDGSIDREDMLHNLTKVLTNSLCKAYSLRVDFMIVHAVSALTPPGKIDGLRVLTSKPCVTVAARREFDRRKATMS